MPALYVHIPFCARKCGYCDFYSEAAGPGDFDRYVAAAIKELDLRLAEWRLHAGQAFAPDTIFFGGGTPTMLPAAHLTRLGEALHARMDLSRVTEWTSEINPGTLTPEKATALRHMGVNRASFGVQSFDPKVLAQLDRAHEAGKVDAALAIARSAGITNLNVDLMFAIPGQTPEAWAWELEQAFARSPSHIALYALTYEDDTPLTAKMGRGEITEMPEAEQAALYRQTVAACRSRGFDRYEVSNFAPVGSECRHNDTYWCGGEWLGIGPGAHSAQYVSRSPLTVQRRANASDHRRYAAALLDDGTDPRTLFEDSSGEALADEILMMALRRREGIPASSYTKLTGISLADRCGPALDEMSGLGLIVWDGQILRLTDEGFLVLDSVVLELTRSPVSLES